MTFGITTRALGAAFALASVVALAGCSSSDTAAADDQGDNATVCTDFESAYNDFTALVASGPVDADVEGWTAAKTEEMQKFAPLADTATGDVEASLTALNSALPADSLELTEPDSASGQAFVDNSTAVASACDAAGTPVTLDEFPLLTF